MAIRAFLLLSLAVPAFAGSKNEGPPVPVAVEGGTRPVADDAAQDATHKGHLTTAFKAQKAWEDLASGLDKTHGKRRDQWPAEAKQQFVEARSVASTALFDELYMSTPQKELDDSANDLKDRLAKHKQAPLAAGRESAVFVIEPVGRARYNRGSAFWCTALDIAPGGAADAAVALAALSKYHEAHDALADGEKFDGSLDPRFAGSWTMPSAQAPRLRVATCGVGMRWRAAAGAMVDLAENLAEAYNAARAANTGPAR